MILVSGFLVLTGVIIWMSNIKDVRCKLQCSWSMAASVSSKLEPVIWSHDTGHIGIHGGVDIPTVVG